MIIPVDTEQEFLPDMILVEKIRHIPISCIYKYLTHKKKIGDDSYVDVFNPTIIDPYRIKDVLYIRFVEFGRLDSINFMKKLTRRTWRLKECKDFIDSLIKESEAPIKFETI